MAFTAIQYKVKPVTAVIYMLTVSRFHWVKKTIALPNRRAKGNYLTMNYLLRRYSNGASLGYWLGHKLYPALNKQVNPDAVFSRSRHSNSAYIFYPVDRIFLSAKCHSGKNYC